MSTDNDELLKVLDEIRNLLIPISTCFEEQYLEIQRQKMGEKYETFKAMLSPIRRKIFPLLFDRRRLSQVEIASEVNTSQPTVSRFISLLQEQDFIEPIKDEYGNTISYRDKYGFIKQL